MHTAAAAAPRARRARLPGERARPRPRLSRSPLARRPLRSHAGPPAPFLQEDRPGHEAPHVS